MSLMEMFANPATFDQLSMNDRLIGSAITAIMGMGTTFVVLTIIWIMIAIMAAIIRKSEKRKKNKEAAHVSASSPSVAPTTVPVAADANTAGAGAEVIAVIAAAIAAYEGGCGSAPTSNLVIRKIVRAAGPTQAWDVAGRREAIESRF